MSSLSYFLRVIGLLSVLTAVASVAGCGDTGQPTVSHPIRVVGTISSAQTVGAWSVKVEVARVAFGPVKFCASQSASDSLCPAALAEWADSAGPIDVLSPSPQTVGKVEGFSGTARSAAYDYALTWLPTQTDPRPTSHALDLPTGHSAHLEGTATSQLDPTVSFRFVADLDVVPGVRGTYAVSSGGWVGVLDASTARLDVAFDANVWTQQIDFEELAKVKDSPVRIAPGSRAYNALLVAMTSLAPPRFAWSR